jgi:hemerythrin-like domain-containing protein
MKRELNLQPLSRQHHNMLMAVLLLKKGLAKNADLQVMRDFIVKVYDEDLAPHMLAEENFLMYTMRNYPALVPHCLRMEAEHALLRELIEVLAFPERATIAIIEKFHQLLEQHIRFEEREAFPLIETTLKTEELENLGNLFVNDKEKNCLHFPTRFWE